MCCLWTRLWTFTTLLIIPMPMVLLISPARGEWRQSQRSFEIIIFIRFILIFGLRCKFQNIFIVEMWWAWQESLFYHLQSFSTLDCIYLKDNFFFFPGRASSWLVATCAKQKSYLTLQITRRWKKSLGNLRSKRLRLVLSFLVRLVLFLLGQQCVKYLLCSLKSKYTLSTFSD